MSLKKIISFFLFFFTIVLVLHLGPQKLIPDAHAAGIIDRAKDAATNIYYKAKSLVAPKATREDLVKELVPKFAKAFQEACLDLGKRACSKGQENNNCCGKNCDCCPLCYGGWKRNVNFLLNYMNAHKDISNLGFFLNGIKDWAAPLKVDRKMIDLWNQGRCCGFFNYDNWLAFSKSQVTYVDLASIYAMAMTENVSVISLEYPTSFYTQAWIGQELINFTKEALGYGKCIQGEGGDFWRNLSDTIASMSIIQGQHGGGNFRSVVGGSLNPLLKYWVPREFWINQANKYYEILVDLAQKYPEYSFLQKNIIDFSSSDSSGCRYFPGKIIGSVKLLTNEQTPENSFLEISVFSDNGIEGVPLYFPYFREGTISFEKFVAPGIYNFRFVSSNWLEGRVYTFVKYDDPDRVSINAGEEKNISFIVDLRVQKVFGQLHLLSDGGIDEGICSLDNVSDPLNIKRESGTVNFQETNKDEFAPYLISSVKPGRYRVYFAYRGKNDKEGYYKTYNFGENSEISVKLGEDSNVDLLVDLRTNITPTPTPTPISCVCCLEDFVSRPSLGARFLNFFRKLFGFSQSKVTSPEGETCCLPEQCQGTPTSTPTIPCLSEGSNNSCLPTYFGDLEGRCSKLGGLFLDETLWCGDNLICCVRPTLTPTPVPCLAANLSNACVPEQACTTPNTINRGLPCRDQSLVCCVPPTVSSPTPTSRPTRTPTPTFTPTPTPRTGWEPNCGCTDDGCTPPEFCRKFYQESICQSQGKSAPCCIVDDNCKGGWSGCGDSVCGTNKPCHKNLKGTNSCQQSYDCGNGSPKPAILRIPNGSSLPLGSSVRLWWWDYGSDLYKGKCSPELGSTPEANWTKWSYACWGYVCAKTDFPEGVVLPEWRYYEVYVRKEGTADFTKLCRIDNIPNPPFQGPGSDLPLDKRSCLLNLDTNDRSSRTYQWFVKAGYKVNTGYETYTDSETRTFTIVSYNLQANCSSDGKSVTLSWNSIPGVTGYNVIINNQSVKTGLTTTSYTVPLSSINQADIYHWWIDPYYGESWNTAPSASGPDFTCGAATQSPTPTLTPIPQGTCEYCRIYDENWNQITDLPTIKLNQRVYLTTKGSLPNNLKARFRINGTANNTWCNGTGLSLVNNWCETTLTHNDMYFLPYTFTAPGRFVIESMVLNVSTGWY